MNRVKLPNGPYSLVRERDSRGNSGQMLRALKWPEGRTEAHIGQLEQVGEEGEIIVGCAVQCGSHFPHSFHSSDWWLTTPVTEILSVNEDSTEVRFLTESGSIYTAKGVTL